MNAACALQHFCDIHGAQTLLCTESKPFIQNSNDDQTDNLSAIYSEYVRSENPSANSRCKSCTISSESLIISTLDSGNNLLFITSQSTPNQDLFKTIRNACVRSLNIEKPMEVNYPILFGDDEDGYCLSLAFSCKDFHARGSQRLYSICYLSRDKYALLSLMTLITECMRQTACWLQADANETYDREGRIKINTNINGTSQNTATYIVRSPPITPTQRMLSDIVHDSKLIFRIHALFVWLLRSTNLAINESLYDALPTEEQTTQQEKRDYFGSTSSQNRQIHSRTFTVVAQSISNTVRTNSVIPTTLVNETEQQSILASSIYSMTDGNFSNNVFDDEEDINSLQYQFSSHVDVAFPLFQLFIRKLNNGKHLQHILYNWTIGNRLIIKYTNLNDNKDLIRALASVFRLLLPDGCFELIEANNQTRSCTANFVLLDTNLIIDDDILRSLHDNSNETHSIVIRIILDDIDDSLRVVKLETPPPTRSEIMVPLYVKSLLEIVNNPSLDEQAFESMIVREKMKYLNKAKLYFQIGRCQSSTNAPPNDRQQMSLVKVENISDLLLIRFWQRGLSQTYRKQIRLLRQDDHQQNARSDRRN